MKLNLDCVRAVLLYLEENLEYKEGSVSMEHTELSISSIADALQKQENFDIKDVQYSIEKLYEVQYINLVRINHNNKKYIIRGYVNDITWEGHNFLNNIRPKSVWDATKAGASKLGLKSVQAIAGLTSKIIDKIINDPVIIESIIQNLPN